MSAADTPFHRLAELMAEQYPDPAPTPQSRRLEYLQGKLKDLETKKRLLQIEVDDLSERMWTFRRDEFNMWHDRLWSAMQHRKSRLPILIEHVESEIAVVHTDIRKHHLYH